MTREEALKNTVMGMIVSRENVKTTINKIYDDIESKSCQNCQHHEERDNYCNLLKVFGLNFCSKFDNERIVFDK